MNSQMMFTCEGPTALPDSRQPGARRTLVLTSLCISTLPRSPHIGCGNLVIVSCMHVAHCSGFLKGWYDDA